MRCLIQTGLTLNTPTDTISGQMCWPLNISTANTLCVDVSMCHRLILKSSLGFVYSHLETPGGRKNDKNADSMTTKEKRAQEKREKHNRKTNRQLARQKNKKLASWVLLTSYSLIQVCVQSWSQGGCLSTTPNERIYCWDVSKQRCCGMEKPLEQIGWNKEQRENQEEKAAWPFSCELLKRAKKEP